MKPHEARARLELSPVSTHLSAPLRAAAAAAAVVVVLPLQAPLGRPHAAASRGRPAAAARPVAPQPPRRGASAPATAAPSHPVPLRPLRCETLRVESTARATFAAPPCARGAGRGGVTGAPGNGRSAAAPQGNGGSGDGGSRGGGRVQGPAGAR